MTQAPKNPDYPALKWHPETGECATFNAAHEVPAGWLDTHPSNVKADEKASDETKTAPEKLPMAKKDIVKALVDGGIEHDPKAPSSVLYGVLDEKLREHLTANNIDIPEGATVPVLLALTAK